MTGQTLSGFCGPAKKEPKRFAAARPKPKERKKA